MFSCRTINRADQDGAVVERLPGAKHRISHSNSSLSSCGSSQSGSHSRISSATTVNEFHTIASSVTEMPLLESGFSASPESVAGAILRHIKPNSPGLSELNVGAARGQSADVETIKSPTDVLLRMKMPNKGSTTANGYRYVGFFLHVSTVRHSLKVESKVWRATPANVCHAQNPNKHSQGIQAVT